MNFVVVDMDQKLPPAQKAIVRDARHETLTIRPRQLRQAAA